MKPGLYLEKYVEIQIDTIKFISLLDEKIPDTQSSYHLYALAFTVTCLQAHKHPGTSGQIRTERKRKNIQKGTMKKQKKTYREART